MCRKHNNAEQEKEKVVRLIYGINTYYWNSFYFYVSHSLTQNENEE